MTNGSGIEERARYRRHYRQGFNTFFRLEELRLCGLPEYLPPTPWCLMKSHDAAAPSYERLVPALPFVALGTISIVAGGLVAAVTAISPTRHATWAAAYLVLVVGVAQLGIGTGQALLAPRIPSSRLITAELLTWDIGNAGVIAGTLLNRVALVDLGGVLLAISLVLFMVGARGHTGEKRWLLYLYRLLIAIVLVSIPIGLIISRGAHQ